MYLTRLNLLNIEEAIKALEKDPNIPKEKIEILKQSFEKLKDKSSIKIRNGELLS